MKRTGVECLLTFFEQVVDDLFIGSLFAVCISTVLALCRFFNSPLKINFQLA